MMFVMVIFWGQSLSTLPTWTFFFTINLDTCRKYWIPSLVFMLDSLLMVFIPDFTSLATSLQPHYSPQGLNFRLIPTLPLNRIIMELCFSPIPIGSTQCFQVNVPNPTTSVLRLSHWQPVENTIPNYDFNYIPASFPHSQQLPFINRHSVYPNMTVSYFFNILMIDSLSKWPQLYLWIYVLCNTILKLFTYSWVFIGFSPINRL